MNGPAAPNPSPTPLVDLIDAYLDGELQGDSLASFNSALEASPELRAQLQHARDLNARLDDALRRRFGPDAMGQPNAQPQPTPESKPGPDSLRFQQHLRTILAGLAALIAISASGLYLYRYFNPKDDYVSPFLISPTRAYSNVQAANFKPEEVCTTPDAFAAWTKSKYNATLRPKATLASLPGNVQYVGWSYTRVISDYSAVLIAKAGGKDVIVILDRTDAQTSPTKECSKNTDLHVFRSNLGAFTLIEVTPLDTPLVSQTLEPVP